ncbi:hypothetical protein VNO77_30484 [Canavalia gladiata]|uniref:FAS1 domain-containing protein n=1 Tax=Canavalia gladiata TaxID=3824 RepID=A0AAN9KRW3_CANGL
MSSRNSFLCLTLLLAFCSSIHAFDITKILGENPEFSNFNRYLTETKLSEQINKRNTITMLVVGNGAISSIASKSPQAIKAIISTHVILDYFDEKRLKEAVGSKQPMTTLYQTSGLARNQEGYIKVAQTSGGSLAFGSAVSGAPIDSELGKVVMTEPYNISVLQISKPIIFPGVDSKNPDAPSPTESAKAPVPSAKAPLPSSHGAEAPAPSTHEDAKAPAPTKGAKAPAPTKGAKAPSPSETTTAPSPSETATAPSPSGTAGSPMDSGAPGSEPASPPEPELAPAPVGDEDPASADAPTDPSSASTTIIPFVGAFMAFASFFVAL